MRDPTSQISYRLSPFQQVFEASCLMPEHGLNIEQVVCTTTESLDLRAFTKSWHRVLDHHPALRVEFKREPGSETRQVIRSSLEMPLAVEDQGALKPEERENFVEKWLETDRAIPFDPASPPLMRVTLLRFADDVTTWVWTFHHILMDGRSFMLVLEDFFACYDAFHAGRDVMLPERKPFAEFIAWQESWLASQRKSAESFWRELVPDEKTDSVLRISRASSSTDRRQKKIKLPTEPGLSEKMLRLAQDLGVTANTIIQGSWSLLLSHYYDSKSITFATVRACRYGSIEGADRLVGLLMNSLPVHACVVENQTVADFLKAIGDQQLAARSYQWTPWDVVRNCIPAAAGKQLADSCVLFERYNIAREMTDRFGAAGVRSFSLRERANIPLFLSVSERPQMQMELSYQSTLFAAEDVLQLSESFSKVLSRVVEAPADSVGALLRATFGQDTDYELPEEQQARRIAYNATDGPVVSGLLHQGFFEMARKQPAEIAIDSPQRKMTYGELAGYALSLARRLQSRGIGKGKLVAVVMDKGWEQIASVLGILRAGAAYLPIDPELPPARLDYILSNGAVTVALTQAHLRSVVAWPSAVERWTMEDGDVEGGAMTNEILEPNPDSLAYVIFTSGSTGAPKGVMISHQAALNTIVDLNRRLEVTARDRVLALSALTFDLSVYDLFGILGCGGTVVLPAPESTRDPRHWIGRMNACGVTIWNSAPALMQMLVTVLDAAPDHLPIHLRWAMLSGDWIPVDLPGRVKEFSPGCRVLSLGGATEVSVWSIAYLIDRVDPAWTSIPYGMPLANQHIYVLDEKFRPCPEGVAGEIYIGGAGLAIGYLADEEKTAERFLRSPLTGERLYRTGDFGRFRPEGYVEFLGRKDTQIKIRGFRIEIGEIEAALLRLPKVREAAALTVPGPLGGKSGAVLVGCLVLDNAAGLSNGTAIVPDENKFRAQLAELLPAHTIPSRIIVMDQLPLSSNGKIDRVALAQKIQPLLTSEPPSPEEEPQDLLERAIWRIWQELLPGQRIGRHDRFYDLGGDSLSVVHMITQVEKMVGRTVGLRPLQQGGTIVDIAAAARESGPVAPPPKIVCVQPGATRPPMFFAHGDLENGGLYCQRLAPNLGADQPLYVISPHGTFGEDSPSTFEEIAASFVALIRSVQPKGPYYLGGFCNGALAMYEAAQQLVRAGEKVPSLILLDPPDLYLFLSRRKMTKLGRLIGLRDRRGRNSYQRIAEGIQIWRDSGPFRFVRDFWTRSITWTIKVSRDLVQKSEPPVSKQPDLNIIYYDAMTSYEPAPYLGDALVILREGEKQRHPRQISYWGGFMPGVRFHEVPGTHLELRENMQEIGQIMKVALGRSESDE